MEWKRTHINKLTVAVKVGLIPCIIALARVKFRSFRSSFLDSANAEKSPKQNIICKAHMEPGVTRECDKIRFK